MRVVRWKGGHLSAESGGISSSFSNFYVAPYFPWYQTLSNVYACHHTFSRRRNSDLECHSVTFEVGTDILLDGMNLKPMPTQQSLHWNYEKAVILYKIKQLQVFTWITKIDYILDNLIASN